MKKFILDNMLELCYYPVSNSYSISIGLYVNAGLLYEPEQLNGITHLLEHMHFRRLISMTQEELYVQMDKIGGTIKGTTYKELLKFSIKIRPCYVKRALELFKEIIMMYEWTVDDVNYEKKVVVNELLSKEAYKNTEAIVDSLRWRNHIFSKSILGKVDTINNISLKDLVNYKKSIFTKGNVSIVVAGNLTGELIEYCNNFFGTIQLNDNKCVPQQNNTSFFFNRRPDISLVHCAWEYVDVDIVFDVVSQESISELIILNSIIGGGTGAKLQKLLREELGLTYDISSYVESYSQGCFFNISFSTHRSNIYDSIWNICTVLKNIKNNITELDMDTNIPYFTENYWYVLEDTEKLNDELGWDLAMRKTPLDVGEKIELFSQIDKSVLTELAKNMFVPNNMCVSVIGNVNKITKKKIREIAFNLLN